MRPDGPKIRTLGAVFGGECPSFGTVAVSFGTEKRSAQATRAELTDAQRAEC